MKKQALTKQAFTKQAFTMLILLSALLVSCGPAVETMVATATASPTLVAPTLVQPTETRKPTPSPFPTLTRAATLTPTVTPTPGPTTPLRTLAEARGFFIGAAVDHQPLGKDPQYDEILAREFNMLTPENAMKFDHIHPARALYTFENADAIVEFAEVHDMCVRGHTLVWHKQLPDWLTDGEWTRDELMEILHDHITTVVGRYRGRVAAWDVVNEAFTSNGTLARTIWLKIIGPEYIELAFQWAHEADPDALLFYNDYQAEGVNNKSNAIYEMAQDFVARGVPIHGVGMQMHVDGLMPPYAEGVAANMARLDELGLQVHITEMDVKISKPVSDDDLQLQAMAYQSMLQVCLEAENCTALVLWGVTDRYSWITLSDDNYGAALIFDENYMPRPALYAIEETLKEE